jgi:hypothetical protein
MSPAERSESARQAAQARWAREREKNVKDSALAVGVETERDGLVIDREVGRATFPLVRELVTDPIRFVDEHLTREEQVSLVRHLACLHPDVVREFVRRRKTG